MQIPRPAARIEELATALIGDLCRIVAGRRLDVNPEMVPNPSSSFW